MRRDKSSSVRMLALVGAVFTLAGAALVGGHALAQVWTEPTSGPPLSNANPPVWNQSSSSQSGSFWLTGTGEVDSKFGIGGTPSAAPLLQITGDTAVTGTVATQASLGKDAILFSTPGGTLNSKAGLVYAFNGNGIASGLVFGRTGSGWGTYVAFHTNSNTGTFDELGERMRIDYNGNVGIGTTTPSQRLDVNGYVRATTGYCLGSDCITAWPTGSGTGYWTASGNNIYNSNSGNVGIGTASPQGKLSVVGSAAADGISAHIYNSSGTGYSALRIGQDGATTQGGTIHYFNPSWSSGGNAAYSPNTWNFTAYGSGGYSFVTNQAAPIAFYVGGLTSAAEKMRISSNGNVGIGTASPGFGLSVARDMTMGTDVIDGTAQMTIQGATVAGKKLLLGYDTNGNGFGFIKAGNQGVAWTALALQPNGGNVGIGTTAPNAALTVGPALTGSALGSTFVSNSGALGSTAGNTLTLANFGFTSGNATSLGIRARRSAAGTDWTTSSVILGMDVDNTANAGAYISLTSSGSVGVGTTSPGAKLGIVGDAASNNSQLVVGPLGGGSSTVSLLGKLRFKSTFDAYAADQGPRVSAQITSGYSGGVWGNEYLSFGVGGAGDAGNDPTERMRLTASGLNVIGDITQNGTKVCLADGANCSGTGGGSMPTGTGTSWVIAPITLADSYEGYRAVTYGDNGAYVAAKVYNYTTDCSTRFSISTNGFNWSNTASQTTITRAITYGNGRYVAVGSYADPLNCGGTSGAKIVSSIDGVTWGNGAGPGLSDTDFSSVVYGGGKFVAVADYCGGADCTNFQVVATSPDGITWTMRTAPNANAWKSVTYGNGMFVAVSNNGTGNRVMTSPDGITWTSRTSAANNSWRSVTYGNGLFVAVADSGTGNRVMTSPDGITWTSRTSAGDYSWGSVIFANNMFVALTWSGSYIMTSSNGINWTLNIVNSGTGSSWTGLVKSPTRVMAIIGNETNAFTIYSPPVAGTGAYQSLYLFSSNSGGKACPSGWTSAGTGLSMYAASGSPFSSYMTSCYAPLSCSTLYLDSDNSGGKACPSGWTSAGTGILYYVTSQASYRTSCYKCN